MGQLRVTIGVTHISLPTDNPIMGEEDDDDADDGDDDDDDGGYDEDNHMMIMSHRCPCQLTIHSWISIMRGSC